LSTCARGSGKEGFFPCTRGGRSHQKKSSTCRFHFIPGSDGIAAVGRMGFGIFDSRYGCAAVTADPTGAKSQPKRRETSSSPLDPTMRMVDVRAVLPRGLRCKMSRRFKRFFEHRLTRSVRGTPRTSCAGSSLARTGRCGGTPSAWRLFLSRTRPASSTLASNTKMSLASLRSLCRSSRATRNMAAMIAIGRARGL